MREEDTRTSTPEASFGCPTRDELRSLLVDDLRTRVYVDTENHLEKCDPCRRALEELAGDVRMWEHAHHLATSGSTGEPSGSNSVDQIRKMLGPSDDPAFEGRVGQYEVSAVIGVGSTGVVLKALDRPLQRFVAIKMLSPHLAHGGAARCRFQRESRAVAALHHENIIPIYGVDEFQGLPYLVMQYVSGTTLAQRIHSEGPLDPIESVRIALQAARALAAAHRAGIIHRDIKPANILLENGLERVFVADFGLARVIDDVSQTHAGVISGTPQFMSPEQAAGEELDERTDLFSLGAVMYAMCSGRPPFRAASLLGTLTQVHEARPESLQSINPVTPEWLEGLIAKLMAKSPSDRFDSAAEVADVLSSELAYLQNPTTTQRPKRPWLPRRRRAHRCRLTPRTLMVAATLAAAVAVVALTPKWRTPPSSQPAVSTDDFFSRWNDSTNGGQLIPNSALEKAQSKSGFFTLDGAESRIAFGDNFAVMPITTSLQRKWLDAAAGREIGIDVHVLVNCDGDSPQSFIDTNSFDLDDLTRRLARFGSEGDGVAAFTLWRRRSDHRNVHEFHHFSEQSPENVDQNSPAIAQLDAMLKRAAREAGFAKAVSRFWEAPATDAAWDKTISVLRDDQNRSLEGEETPWKFGRITVFPIETTVSRYFFGLSSGPVSADAVATIDVSMNELSLEDVPDVLSELQVAVDSLSKRRQSDGLPPIERVSVGVAEYRSDHRREALSELTNIGLGPRGPLTFRVTSKWSFFVDRASTPSTKLR